jgi:hypothetical protein
MVLSNSEVKHDKLPWRIVNRRLSSLMFLHPRFNCNKKVYIFDENFKRWVGMLLSPSVCAI